MENAGSLQWESWLFIFSTTAIHFVVGCPGDSAGGHSVCIYSLNASGDELAGLVASSRPHVG